jgi:hypothetical protein
MVITHLPQVLAVHELSSVVAGAAVRADPAARCPSVPTGEHCGSIDGDIHESLAGYSRPFSAAELHTVCAYCARSSRPLPLLPPTRSPRVGCDHPAVISRLGGVSK